MGLALVLAHQQKKYCVWLGFVTVGYICSGVGSCQCNYSIRNCQVQNLHYVIYWQCLQFYSSSSDIMLSFFVADSEASVLVFTVGVNHILWLFMLVSVHSCGVIISDGDIIIFIFERIILLLSISNASGWIIMG